MPLVFPNCATTIKFFLKRFFSPFCHKKFLIYFSFFSCFTSIISLQIVPAFTGAADCSEVVASVDFSAAGCSGAAASVGFSAAGCSGVAGFCRFFSDRLFRGCGLCWFFGSGLFRGCRLLLVFQPQVVQGLQPLLVFQRQVVQGLRSVGFSAAGCSGCAASVQVFQ